jgi:hypothetical protein
MNMIHQISLKLQLGLDPACKIQSEELLEQWQAFNEKRCRARAIQRKESLPPAGNGEQARRRQRVN